ncbi:uncharacterized protein LOC135710390 [Ochlerotatus camptorhynchus]|uniref:uncharacterized protein LOC135710390 n=1 Tax=Ochlerotatus camptorhynchus TaxID=644619 RepID=UPI0031E30CD3
MLTALGGALSHSAYNINLSAGSDYHDGSDTYDIDLPVDQSGSHRRDDTSSTITARSYPTPALPKPVNFILQWNINGFLNHIGDLELLCHDDPPWVIALQETNKATTDQMKHSLGGKYTCAYLPCGRLPNLHDQLSEGIAKLPKPRILVGDLNGHHPSWGCPRSDPRGVTLVDIFEKEDMSILSDGVPTYSNGRHTSAIDVSAVSRCFAGKTQWSANTDLYGFDHYPIKVQLSTAIFPMTTRRPRWRYEQADWDSYGEAFQSLLLQRNPNSIEDFSEVVYEAATATIPKTSSVPGRKALRWWNEDTRKAVKARRKALRRVKRLPIEDAESHNQCRQEIRVAKRTSWMEFLNEFVTVFGRLMEINGEAVSDPAIVADELSSYFADLEAIKKYEDEFKRKAKPLTSSIASFSVSSDAGNSDINQAFNKLWLTNSYPASWKESLVIPIPKANETTREASKFRSIALTCCMAKVLERMVNRRLKHFLEAENLLDHRHHAFHQGYGTSTYFATLGEVLKSANDSGLHTKIVSLDISKAFNRTWTPLVFQSRSGQH